MRPTRNSCFAKAQHSERLWALAICSQGSGSTTRAVIRTVRSRRRYKVDPLTDDPGRSMTYTAQRTSPPVGRCSSNHWRTPFFATRPITRIWSPSGRSRYSLIIQPHTLHRSSHSASKSSHQQFSGADGSAIPIRRVVRKIAEHTMVGTEYSAYTGVCKLAHAQGVDSSEQMGEMRRNLRVVKIAPCLRAYILPVYKA